MNNFVCFSTAIFLSYLSASVLPCKPDILPNVYKTELK